ncbi:HNH endonuclease [Streptomyces sp. NPDC020412]|uniref:HNH endonuclease n=1 Tax=Streptomyces sp. NPDC020412 TaxID=3365073 RepID=UPI003787DC01
MALGDVGSAQVLAAVDEFDRIGRDAFLTKYGFKPSRTYLLVVGGRHYDSKAVVGAAHGHLPGREPLAASEFSGGREHAVKLLVGLGFEVVPGREGVAGPMADPVALAAQYQRLCVRVEVQAGSGGRRRDEVRRAPVRSGAARQAVLLRSRGRCENPDCAGQPEDVTEQGDPILEVDHVIELAQDGPDHPSHMVALCPNCHAVKTRGRTGPALKAAAPRGAGVARKGQPGGVTEGRVLHHLRHLRLGESPSSRRWAGRARGHASPDGAGVFVRSGLGSRRRRA